MYNKALKERTIEQINFEKNLLYDTPAEKKLIKQESIKKIKKEEFNLEIFKIYQQSEQKQDPQTQKLIEQYQFSDLPPYQRIIERIFGRNCFCFCFLQIFCCLQNKKSNKLDLSLFKSGLQDYLGILRSYLAFSLLLFVCQSLVAYSYDREDFLKGDEFYWKGNYSISTMLKMQKNGDLTASMKYQVWYLLAQGLSILSIFICLVLQISLYYSSGRHCNNYFMYSNYVLIGLLAFFLIVFFVYIYFCSTGIESKWRACTQIKYDKMNEQIDKVKEFKKHYFVSQKVEDQLKLWLISIQLEKYYENFTENEITLDQLVFLNNQRTILPFLDKLGIKKLGDQAQIMISLSDEEILQKFDLQDLKQEEIKRQQEEEELKLQNEFKQQEEQNKQEENLDNIISNQQNQLQGQNSINKNNLSQQQQQQQKLPQKKSQQNQNNMKNSQNNLKNSEQSQQNQSKQNK
ncbi:Sterile alpha motif/pointed domain [Pseudocohnilembus persalinus]|uniref:Sterile alpha motif/pointed domain n=1 Tax=Pseudocohnilembus persalinus TaxID=266149 RepID=A0A0V0QV70_PSEPJ|nr:Sterile alpha motif/pointed domain [Pseudocohnilembus persalinus]|eukprot:KRX06207.1 Sterile alpha motif/pointed domain [Pseudocohnilembus persalinus]